MLNNELSTLIYSPLFEEKDNKQGWNKQTVDYVLRNKGKVKGIIGKCAKGVNKLLSSTDIEDCFTEVLINFYKNKDYDINVAIEKARKDEIISFESYVYSIIKFTTMRFISERASIESKEVSAITYNKDDKEELNLLDNIASETDNGSNLKLEYGNLDTICKQYESQRYKYIVDIFQIWFIKLLLIKYNKENLYKDILETIGINKENLRYMKKQSKHSEAMLDISKAVSVVGVETAISVLRNYTYSAGRLEKLVEMI